MRMSCNRSDAELTNQAAEVPRLRASSRRACSQSSFYNRLENRRSFRLMCAAARSILRLHAPLTEPFGLLAPGTHIQLAKPQAFLSLMQGRQSCQQQLWGVAPFRRDIA
jgi:hypothetical protein